MSESEGRIGFDHPKVDGINCDYDLVPVSSNLVYPASDLSPQVITSEGNHCNHDDSPLAKFQCKLQHQQCV